jgi:hypothetical protein
MATACAAAQAARIAKVHPPRVTIEVELPKGSAVEPAMSFALYRERHDARPLWSSVQTVTRLGRGKLRVVLGLGSEDGLPASLLTACRTLWLEVEGRRVYRRIPLQPACAAQR